MAFNCLVPGKQPRVRGHFMIERQCQSPKPIGAVATAVLDAVEPVCHVFNKDITDEEWQL